MTPQNEQDSAPDVQQCHYLILQVISQAIKDYEHYRHKTRPEDVEVFESARDFLLSDAYYVDWGDEIVNLDCLCTLMSIEVNWLRKKIMGKLEIEMLTDGRIVPKKVF